MIRVVRFGSRFTADTSEVTMKRLAILAVTLLGACVNPYAKFYQGVPDARVRPDYVPQTGPLQIYSTTDFTRDGYELMRRGFIAIGQSSFNANMNMVSQAQLQAEADRIGAHVVLVSSHYTNSVTGAVPFTVPTTSTTTTSGSATAYGSGGYATATGTSTSTTTGTQTTMIPYTIVRGDFNALYFARVRSRLGLLVLALDDATRVRLQSNFGVRVVVVVEGSPAFNAEVLPGDILLQVGDDRVSSPEQFTQLLNKYEGQRTTLRLDRGGQSVEKSVTLARISGQ